jgi:uncharacterized protein (TIGR02391 family)
MGVDAKKLAKGRLASAAAIQQNARNLALIPPTEKKPVEKSLYYDLVRDEDLKSTTEKLFFDGHYASAVEEAYKCLNNIVKKKSGSTADGANLMRSVFSPKNPTLKLSDLKSQSKKDQQQGYMDILAGVMMGIRNPRAHTHQYKDGLKSTLEMLAWANHLIELVKKTTKARTRKTKS